MIQWHQYRFDQLSLDQLYEVIALRVAIFVVEQNCPYLELDDKDREPQTIHLLGIDEQGKLIAYARILAPGVSYPQASIGRILVAKKARGAGVGQQLVNRAVAALLSIWSDAGIQIGAQAHLVDFYESLGFIVNSKVYLEDDIPHLDMLYPC